MKDFMLPLVLVIGAGAVIYYFWLMPTVPVVPLDSFDPGVTAVESASPPGVAAPKPPARRASTVKRTNQTATDPIVPEAIALELPPLAVAGLLTESTPAQATVSPPSPSDVRVGMPRSRVVELLGSPDLKTTTIRRGTLLETYVYTHTTQGEFVRIQLRGGRVVNEAY